MYCGLWLKDQSKMLYVPNGYFTISKMSMKLSQGTKYDL
jgi:hypothetical protein